MHITEPEDSQMALSGTRASTSRRTAKKIPAKRRIDGTGPSSPLPATSRIPQLPSEILVEIASHATVKTLKNASLACREFRRCFQPQMFRNVLWISSYYPRSSYRGYTRARCGHALSTILTTDNSVSLQIRRVVLSSAACSMCLAAWDSPYTAEPPCNLLLASLSVLSLLKELHLSVWWVYVYERLPVLPSLTTLILGGAEHDEYSHGLNVEELLDPLTRCPKLQQLEYTSWKDDRAVHIWPMSYRQQQNPSGYEPSTPLPRMKVVTLGQTFYASSTTLQHVLAQCTALRSLNIVKPAIYVNKSLLSLSTDAIVVNCRWRDLLAAMITRRDTLEELSLMPYFDELCLEDRTLLGTLEDFTSLKKLVVDPKMLIGFHVCPVAETDYLADSHKDYHLTFPSIPNLQPRHNLASMLPRDLECLTILIDVDQARRIAYYREHIVAGLITEKKSRLLNLKRVVMYERGVYQIKSYWGPDRYCLSSCQCWKRMSKPCFCRFGCRCEKLTFKPCVNCHGDDLCLPEAVEGMKDACSAAKIELVHVGHELEGARWNDKAWYTFGTPFREF